LLSVDRCNINYKFCAIDFINLLILTSFGATPEIAIVISLGGYITKKIIPGSIGLIISFIENLHNVKRKDTCE